MTSYLFSNAPITAQLISLSYLQPSDYAVETFKAGMDNTASCNAYLDLLRNLGFSLGSS